MSSVRSDASGVARATTPSVSDLASAIRDRIVSGEYAPNQRLIEADLSGTFGAGRAGIRAALFELANEGLIERLPNRGSRVRYVSVAEAVEILEVRMGLESLCAAKAAERISEQDILELTELRGSLIAAASSGDLTRYSELNQFLDQRIRELSGHSTAVAIIERLRAQSVRHQFKLSFQTGRAAISAPEHVAIIDAVISRDAALARKATRRHLLSVIAAISEQG